MTPEAELELIRLGGTIVGGLIDMFHRNGLAEQAAAAQTLKNTLDADADWDRVKADDPNAPPTA